MSTIDIVKHRKLLRKSVQKLAEVFFPTVLSGLALHCMPTLQHSVKCKLKLLPHPSSKAESPSKNLHFLDHIPLCPTY